MPKYNSREKANLYQSNPVKIKNINNPKWDHGYTMSLMGHKNESYKKVQDLIRNDKLKPNQWHLILLFSKVYSPETIHLWKKFWKPISNKLRECGIEAHGEYETNHKNQLHIHMLINSKHSEKQLLQILKKCMTYTKSGRQDGWRKYLEAVDDNGIINYVCKAKIKEYKKGKMISHDAYANKRLLFKPGLGLKKCFFIGKYWVEPAGKRKVKEKKIKEGKKDSRIMDYVDHVYAMVKDDPNANIHQMKRNYALFDVRDPLKQTCTEYECEDIDSEIKPD